MISKRIELEKKICDEDLVPKDDANAYPTNLDVDYP